MILPKYSMERAFPKSLEKTIESKCRKSAVVTVIVLKIMCPACSVDASAKVQPQDVQVLYIWKLVMKKKFEI